jgi:hypothetical protein
MAFVSMLDCVFLLSMSCSCFLALSIIVVLFLVIIHVEMGNGLHALQCIQIKELSKDRLWLSQLKK